MLTTLEMARGEFGLYAAHLAIYRGEVEPLHGHTFSVTLRLSGEPDTSGRLAARFGWFHCALSCGRIRTSPSVIN